MCCNKRPFPLFASLALIAAILACSSLPIPTIGSQEPTLLSPVLEGEKYGYMDRTGQVVIPAQFDGASRFFEDLAAVKVGSVFGYIDTDGKMVIEPQFSDANKFSDGLALVGYEEGGGLKLAYIDQTGKKVILFDFIPFLTELNFNWGTVRILPAGDFSDGLAYVDDRLGDKRYYVDPTGKTALDASEYQSITSFHEGLAGVMRDRMWGFIDKTGRIVVSPQFDSVGPFSGGLAYVRDGELFGFIDSTGSMKIEPQFEAVSAFSEGLAVARKGGLYGHIDENGNFTIQPVFEEAYDFSEDLAVIKMGGLYGYIDKTGQAVIQPQFSSAGDFLNGLALVWLDNEQSYIDRTGKYIWNPQGTVSVPIPTAAILPAATLAVEPTVEPTTVVEQSVSATDLTDISGWAKQTTLKYVNGELIYKPYDFQQIWTTDFMQELGDFTLTATFRYDTAGMDDYGVGFTIGDPMTGNFFFLGPNPHKGNTDWYFVMVTNYEWLHAEGYPPNTDGQPEEFTLQIQRRGSQVYAIVNGETIKTREDIVFHGQPALMRVGLHSDGFNDTLFVRSLSVTSP